MWLILVQAAEMSGTNLSIGTRLPMLGGSYLLTLFLTLKDCYTGNVKTLLKKSEYLCHCK